MIKYKPLHPTSCYDAAIIGGGLAGLSLAIQLARQGYAVVVLEKEKYPFHKVCGEYISNESWNFLESLGVPLTTWEVPAISRLQVTAPNGSSLQARLPLGGFGISRYRLDQHLAQVARQSGATVLEETKTDEVVFQNDLFLLKAVAKNGSRQTLQARICCGTFGKRSNLDVKWKRSFVVHTNTRISNYIGVKYHVHTQWPPDLIGLHNFQDGYCGISKIEDDRYCLCYLAKAAHLKNCGQSIAQMEEKILYRNPILKNIFLNSQKLEGFPVAISQISFSAKKQVEQKVLMIGDAAGMITPLCGNGMSMALHGSKIAAQEILQFLQGRISRRQLEHNFTAKWLRQFSVRLQAGRVLQSFFGSEVLSNGMVQLFRALPFLKSFVIRQTHGRPF